MFRSLLALLVATLLTPAAPAKNVSIRWHGQSFFEIRSSGGTRVVIDPHILEAYGRKQIKADLVLISHFHNDHMGQNGGLTAVDGVTDFLKPGKVKVVFGLKNKKGPLGNRDDDAFNEVDVKVGDVHVEAVGTYHDDMQGLRRGKNTVFILEVDGLRIAHLGDLGHTLSEAQIKKIGKVDVLLIPVGGIYTLNGSEAKTVVAQLKPRRYIIPMHYGTKVYEDLLGPEEFLEEQKEGTVKQYKTNELVVDSEAAVPANPIIAVLNYEEKSK